MSARPVAMKARTKGRARSCVCWGRLVLVVYFSEWPCGRYFVGAELEVPGHFLPGWSHRSRGATSSNW